MAFTKINAAGIGTTETVTVDGLTVINDGSFGGNLTVSGVLTYEDVTNVDSVGLITARNGIVVGSGITLSKDGDIFATGITTVSGNVKVGTGITLSPDGDVFFTGVGTGNGSGLTALNASNLASGTVPTARLGSGTASSSTFLRGDSTFQVVNTDLSGDSSPQLGGDLDLNGNIIRVDDGGKDANQEHIRFGDDGDLRIYHNGNNSFIENFTGNLHLKGKTGEESIVAIPDGAVEIYYDNSKKFETTNTGITISGSDTTGSVVQGDFRLKKADATQHIVYDASNARMNFADNVSATFGDANDIQIFHDGTNNVVKNTTTAELRFMYDTQYMLRCIPQAAVRIYYANSTKAQTTNTGFMVNGNLELVDNNKLYLGASGDLQIYHDGSNSYLYQDGTGELRANASTFRVMDRNGGETQLLASENGAVELYHDNTKRFETESAGIKSRGTLKFTSEDQNVTHNKNLYYLVVGTNSTSTITLTSLNGTGLIRIGGYANAGQGALALHIIFGGAMFATQHYQSTELQNSAMQNTSISLSKNATNYTIAISNSSGSSTLNLSVYLESTGGAIGYAVS